MLTWQVREYEEVTSTQVVADELARGGAPEGTVVVARGQAAGEGRFGRRWLSPRGGLYASIVLRPRRAIGAHLLTLVGALAAVEGVKQETGISPRIRWPNDIVILGTKLGGVIARATTIGESITSVVVGIGVNCNFSVKELGEFARASVTLLDLLGRRVDLDSLRTQILRRFSDHYQQWYEGGEEELARLVRPVLSTTGKEVEYKHINRGIERGLVKEMQDDGSILLVKGDRTASLRAERSEERRVGKECRSRWSPYH